MRMGDGKSSGSSVLFGLVGIVLGGAVVLAGCSSSSNGGTGDGGAGGGSCSALASCCTGASLDACKAVVAEGNASDCTAAREVYCGSTGGGGGDSGKPAKDAGGSTKDGGTSNGSCTRLAACCSGVSLDACKAIVTADNATTCTSALQVYCGIVSDAGSDGGGGTETFSCYLPKSAHCSNYKDVDPSTAAGLATNCMLQGGTMGGGCPTDDLAGCCTLVYGGETQEDCYYEHTAAGVGTGNTPSSVSTMCSEAIPAETFSATP